MAISGSIGSEQRRAELGALVEAAGRVEIDDAAQRFGVSAMTIRRDLMDMEAEGTIRRVRGGAVRNIAPLPFDQRRASRAGAKQTIARKALALVPASGVVSFDASTTIATLASALGPRSGLTVATNAIETLAALGPIDGVSPLLVGGQPEPTTGSLVGPMACRGASELFSDAFFTAAAAVDPERGGTEVSLLEAEVKRVFAAHARRTYLCVDSSKLGQSSVARSLELADVTALVTELSPDDARLDPYRDLVSLI